MERQAVDQIVAQVLAILNGTAGAAAHGIPVGVSSRHIHLSAEHRDILFGSGYQLTKEKELTQPGEFAAIETVTLVGPKGALRGVRVLGPLRRATQVEISRTDGFLLGTRPPVRDSGDLAGSAGIIVAGPAGAVTLPEGVIVAARHIHMRPEKAKLFQVKDGDRVEVAAGGVRGGSLHNVLVRVQPDFSLEFHIDTDEANAIGLNNGDLVQLRRSGEV